MVDWHRWRPGRRDRRAATLVLLALFCLLGARPHVLLARRPAAPADPAPGAVRVQDAEPVAILLPPAGPPPLTQDGDWFANLTAKGVHVFDSASPPLPPRDPSPPSSVAASSARSVSFPTPTPALPGLPRALPAAGGVAGLRRVLDAVVPADVRAYVDAVGRRHPASGVPSGHDSADTADTVLLTPADLTPPAILDMFFADERDRFPHVLTYRPRVDCEHGRYLWVTNLVHDGFGMGFAKHTIKVLLQMEANLTGVHVPFESNHPPETPAEQDAFLGEGDWDVAAAELQACPPGSAVKRNVLLLHNESAITRRTLEFAEGLRRQGGAGGLVRISGDAAVPPPVLEGALILPADVDRLYRRHQWLFQVRWRCRNHPYAGAALHPDMLAQARSDVPFRMHLGVHIRRGDVVDPATGGPAPLYERRFRQLAYYFNVTRHLLAHLDALIEDTGPSWWLRPVVTVYSEGAAAEFAELAHNLTALGYRTLINLDTKTSRVFAELAETDATVLAVESAFSCSAYLHLHRVRVGPDRVDLAPCRVVTVSDHDHIADAGRGAAARRVWAMLLEWKLRRAEHLARCTAFTRACLTGNPYLFSPIGPIGESVLPGGGWSAENHMS